MDSIKLSKRLKTIAQFTVENKQVFDIGSNHAYLPIYLIQNETIPNAIASEVSIGPFEQAIQEVKKYKLENKLEVRLGDGFIPLKKNEMPGTIFICGMGSKLIENILKKGIETGKLSAQSRLVLQPNRNEKDLRLFLQNNNYQIIQEEILEEKNKFYEIIVAEKTNEIVNYTDEELIFGPILLDNKNDFFYNKWTDKLSIYEEIKESISAIDIDKKEQKEKVEEKIKLIKKVLL